MTSENATAPQEGAVLDSDIIQHQVDGKATLAALTAMKKAVDARLKEVRAAEDADLMDMYAGSGVEKVALRVGGEKVGELLVTFDAAGFEVTDRGAFEDFALTYGLATERMEVRQGCMHEAIVVIAEHAPELLEGHVCLEDDWQRSLTPVGDHVEFMDSGLTVPGIRRVPRKPKGTMVRGCKPEETLPLLADTPVRALMGVTVDE